MDALRSLLNTTTCNGLETYSQHPAVSPRPPRIPVYVDGVMYTIEKPVKGCRKFYKVGLHDANGVCVSEHSIPRELFYTTLDVISVRTGGHVYSLKPIPKS